MGATLKNKWQLLRSTARLPDGPRLRRGNPFAVAASPSSPVKVKPMEWHQPWPDDTDPQRGAAVVLGLAYFADRRGAGWTLGLWYWGCGQRRQIGDYDTLALAQAAAQSDYRGSRPFRPRGATLMGKEQLKRCPFCGGPAELDFPANIGAGNGVMKGMAIAMCRNIGCRGNMVNWRSTKEAIAAWNRRSSDEQAEVVGYILPKNLAEDVFQYTVYRIRSVAEAHAEKGSAVALYASPPAVAAGGVTEEMVETAMSAYWGFNPVKSRTARDRMVEALTAALAVRDEGIPEGERFPLTLGKVHQAIDGYVQALVDRQHGGVAQDRAFNAICEALGRSPTAEMDARRRPTPPSRGEGV